MHHRSYKEVIYDSTSYFVQQLDYPESRGVTPTNTQGEIPLTLRYIVSFHLVVRRTRGHLS